MCDPLSATIALFAQREALLFQASKTPFSVENLRQMVHDKAVVHTCFWISVCAKGAHVVDRSEDPATPAAGAPSEAKSQGSCFQQKVRSLISSKHAQKT